MMEGWYSVFLYAVLVVLGICILLALVRAIRGPGSRTGSWGSI